MAPPPEPEPVDLAEIAVIEPVIDPEPMSDSEPVVVAVAVESMMEPVPEDVREINEPADPPPVTIAADMPRLFIPDGFPIEDVPLPPEIQRFAPWTWSAMELMGMGLTIGAIVSALSLLLWYFAQWN